MGKLQHGEIFEGKRVKLEEEGRPGTHKCVAGHYCYSNKFACNTFSLRLKLLFLCIEIKAVGCEAGKWACR